METLNSLMLNLLKILKKKNCFVLCSVEFCVFKKWRVLKRLINADMFTCNERTNQRVNKLCMDPPCPFLISFLTLPDVLCNPIDSFGGKGPHLRQYQDEGR